MVYPLVEIRLFDLLREEELLIIKKKKYTKTTNSKHCMRRYPNLVKGIQLQRPEQLWVADITYLSLSDRYCYLHLVTDAYSKQIMGYNVSETLAANETLKALDKERSDEAISTIFKLFFATIMTIMLPASVILIIVCCVTHLYVQ